MNRKKGVILISVIICLIAVGVIGFIGYHRPRMLGVISPLAEGHTQGADQFRFILDKTSTKNYPPNENFPLTLQPKFTDTLDVSVDAYAVMERGSRELLLAKNLTKELPIASVTKIMTALVALEKGDLDLELRVSSPAAEIGEAEMGLTPDERLTVEELLYGLLLPSGNDAAETLAEDLGPGRTSFMIAMNEKAKSLGLYDTFYFNPTGLDGDTIETTSFSTCLDLLALTNYALENPKFAEIISTYYKEIPYREGKHKAFYLYNILQLDRAYPGIKGVKPGNTDFAGETLVSYAENGGKELIVVLLGAVNSRDEVVKVYNYVFRQLGVEIAREG